MIAIEQTAPEKTGVASTLRAGLYVLLFMVLSALSAIAFDQVLRVVTLKDEQIAMRIESVAVIPPAPGFAMSPGPAKASLPYRCPLQPETWVCEAGFQLTYRHQARPDGAITSLYAPYFSGRLQIYLNRTLIADSAWADSPSYLGQSAPLLVPLPEPLLHEGDNEIVLRLASVTYGGTLGRLFIDADHRLRGDYTTTRMMVATLPRLLEGMVIAMGVFMLLIWTMRRQDHLYLVLGIQLLSWATPALVAALIDDPSLTTIRLANIARFIFSALTLPFTWLFLGRRQPVPTWVFLLLPLAAFICAFLPGGQGTWIILKVLIPISVIILLVSNVILMHAVIVDRNRAALPLLCMAVIGVVFIMRDHFVALGILQNRHIQLTRFNGPMVATVMGLIVLGRYAGAMTAVERFNSQLRQAVAAAEEKLRQTFAREQEQARKAVLEAERMRLMGDLHDGIAGHLVSIISLCEQRSDPQNQEVAQASRQALTDLRLVIDSLEDVGDDLGMMLAVFRERIEPQLRRNGIRLDWRVRALPDLPGLHPAVTLAIFRILQEAVSNAVKHSGAPAVQIDAVASPRAGYGMRLTVCDQGRGGAVRRNGGFGMENMRRRAATIGADLSVESSPGAGTRVILDLPARLNRPAQTAG